MHISYSVKNLRRLKKTPLIEIKPITILVGRNNAGKSTYLRSMPLIRQSIETRSSAPILWLGDYVDFGDFKTAVSNSGKKNEITFSFFISNLKINNRYHSLWFDEINDQIEGIDVSYTVNEYKGKTYLKRIDLSVPSKNIDLRISFSSKSSSLHKIKLNNSDVLDLLKKYTIDCKKSNLFACPILVDKINKNKNKNKKSSSRYVPYEIILSAIQNEHPKPRKKLKKGTKKSSSLFHYRLESSHAFELHKMVSTHELNQATIKTLKNSKSNGELKEFKGTYTKLINTPNSIFSKTIYSLHKLNWCFSILETLDGDLNSYFRDITYIGPVRSASERFYRKQELEVSEISPDGKNFPMFLDSLSQEKFLEFSGWVEDIFGYGIELRLSDAHISIDLKSKNNSINVTDTGYGVSQFLPVLGAIWWSCVRQDERSGYSESSSEDSKDVRTVVIEQPELHLHPAHQAKLADVFVKAISQTRKNSKSKRDIKLVVETHSETFINRLGELIEDENSEISHDDVQIVIFSAEDDLNSPTEVKLSNYDDRGVLNKWPFGFFNYD